MANINEVNSWTAYPDTNKGYEIFHLEDEDTPRCDLHSHDFHEICLLTGGIATYIVENNKYTLESGDILLLPKDSLYQRLPEGNEGKHERYILALQPHFVNSLSTSNTALELCFTRCRETNNYLIRDSELYNNAVNIIAKLYASRSDISFGNDIEDRLNITNILLILGKYLQKIGGKTNTSNMLTNEHIVNAIKYVDNNIDGDLSLECIADDLSVSKYYLTRLFRQETGTPLHQYILKKRLVLSKELISRNLPILEVYSRCGFSDYTHFFRAFKQEYNMTPKEYCAKANGRM